jgi:hypothetical protein
MPLEVQTETMVEKVEQPKIEVQMEEQPKIEIENKNPVAD